jgi:hypothetical protein
MYVWFLVVMAGFLHDDPRAYFAGPMPEAVCQEVAARINAKIDGPVIAAHCEKQVASE